MGYNRRHGNTAVEYEGSYIDVDKRRKTNDGGVIFQTLHNRRKAVEETRKRRRGYVSMAFNKDTAYFPIFEGVTTFPEIKEVGYEDVTNKYFLKWFFDMEDWADISSDNFDFGEITHGEYGNLVYGYFNGAKLDGIIRVTDTLNNPSDKVIFEISFFFVNKAVQSQGIGQKLLQYVLDNFGKNELILYVYTDNDNAIHIYKKFGFEIIGTNYYKGYRGSDPHYIMKREPKLRW